MSSTNSVSSGTPAPSRRLRDTLVLAGLFGLVMVGLIGLAAATGWEETRAQIAKLSIWQVLFLLVLSLVNYLFRGLRWHIFARRLGLPTGLAQDLRHFLGGFAMSVTPGRVGELVRMRWLKRETGWNFERTAPLVLVDRASDLTAMALILAMALSFSMKGIAGGVPVALLALIAGFVATRPALLAGFAKMGHRVTGRFARLWVKIRRAAKSLSAFTSPTLMTSAAILGVIGWIAEGYAFHLLLVWLGSDIGFATAVAIFVFSTLAGGLTGAPGGVGGAEAAMIALLALEGVPLEVSVPATAIIRVTTLWFAIGIGLLIFPLAERHSLTTRKTKA
ncbi:lysylphosphatidylglycerol synthase transmembrane domain-containing protein [Aliiroseovarius sp. KMU-50]|uniref:Lysylphosphatidylglycerol synthase transmembrane domain-containing protein n=1 Tax=Aliiroseovarius salicola TaxID=3009082 RepID=A0ABT4W0J8_9RHOB|nr:lysylphosphatidylglycerol synthase transmembrane domain-containing protein [Aliiroseovarius sp. KMU-50]MDA5094034.1 lysylphosphatidylglycerol synthase transmembrane domain-containing protein [Aliiroseovarius sp. KMU-50]